jgi:hypothetical protein
LRREVISDTKDITHNDVEVLREISYENAWDYFPMYTEKDINATISMILVSYSSYKKISQFK